MDASSVGFPMTLDYDVVIVGGGITGLASAVCLKKTCPGLKVVVFADKAPSMSSTRCSALNPKSQRVLSQWGVWDTSVLQSDQSGFQHIHVWEGNTGTGMDFHAKNQALLGQPYLGYVVSNQALIHALRAQLSVQDIEHRAIHRVHRWQGGLALTLDQGKQVTTRLLVGADGPGSWVRNHFDFSLHRWPYHQHALVARVHTEKNHLNTAWQHFFSGQIVALLPWVDTHQGSIVWSTSAQHAQALLHKSPADFGRALTEAMDHRLGALQLSEGSTRHTWPLHMQYAADAVQPHVVLVGDAAHTIHPLAGQGLNLGLDDVVVLSQVIARAVQQGEPLGSLHVLRRYARVRQPAVWRMIMAIQGLKWIFGSESSAIRSLRGFGMQHLNKMHGLKRLIQRSFLV